MGVCGDLWQIYSAYLQSTGILSIWLMLGLLQRRIPRLHETSNRRSNLTRVITLYR